MKELVINLANYTTMHKHVFARNKLFHTFINCVGKTSELTYNRSTNGYVGGLLTEIDP
jgi:hypothetical protein